MGFTAIHPPGPAHLIICFKLLCNTLLGYHLFYKLTKHIFRLLIDVGQATIQLPAE